MAFAKGQSGNPNGRPKVDMEVRDAARLHGKAAIEKLVALLGGEDQRLALAAAQAILDRGYGKPAQSVEVSGDPDNPLTHVIERRIVRPGN